MEIIMLFMFFGSIVMATVLIVYWLYLLNRNLSSKFYELHEKIKGLETRTDEIDEKAKGNERRTHCHAESICRIEKIIKKITED